MKNNFGFTLIELLVVIGVITILLSIILIAINPARQFGQASDLSMKAAVYDIDNAAGIYFATEKAYPWEKNTQCKEELEAGGEYSSMGACIQAMTGFDEDELPNYQKNKYKKIHASKCKDQAVLCYIPPTKEIIEDAVYDKWGVVKPGCPGNSRDEDCYWCKRVKTNEVCEGGPDPTPTSTPSANINWGKAISLHGYPPALDPNYPDSKIPNEEVLHRNFTSGMEINSPSLTVEAWIKPDNPVPLHVTHTINQSIFQLTLDASWEDENTIDYEYYFTVRHEENGCGRTVVYSGGRLIGGRKIGHIKVTPEKFNTWKHIAGVLDNNELRIYENGKHMSTYTVSSTYTVCNEHTKDLNIGAFSTPYNYMGYYLGLIDEMRVSTIPRYHGDYQVPTGPFTPDEHTMYLFHFDGDTKDSSGNNFDTNIVGGDVEFVDSDIFPDLVVQHDGALTPTVASTPIPTSINSPTSTPQPTVTPTPQPTSVPQPSGTPESYVLDDSPKFYETYVVLTYDDIDLPPPNRFVDISFRPDFGGIIHKTGFGFFRYGEPVTADADTIVNVAYVGDGNTGSPTSISNITKKSLTSKLTGYISMPYHWKQYREGCGKTVYWRIVGWPGYEDTGLAGPTYANVIDCDTKVGAFNSTGEDPYNVYIYRNYINNDGSVRDGQPYHPTFDPNKDGKIDWVDLISLSILGITRSGGWEPPE